MKKETVHIDDSREETKQKMENTKKIQSLAIERLLKKYVFRNTRKKKGEQRETENFHTKNPLRVQ